ncbi:MAG: bifunctional 5,10-methylenetetrahydrofolate dehydrogenase/5,10-methenyltetrahydrofolate cyclohydrolase [Lewinellaceae bacterium]|nr:bifunctional 5,10-methylenetetrahydrofolate dehydrogenase/5,10-methenyltetrahydrofolate cyclohydrolase [Phaeodactylibacter sp.]MCB9040944.1 bifunctional 5,10-methylenetetrahydrofolate dehydrogenase/5,10-methenyltetrahydrofolate cyclohydrolase [Lewinellaceae bacterium]
MNILDGRQLAKTIRAELAEEVKAIVAGGGRPPHLAAVLVGEDPASQVYVRNKVRSCEKAGFRSTLVRKPADTGEADLLAVVDQLNRDDEVDGFIVQLPLPGHINEEKVTLAIRPEKDVDGFHPVNFGRMAQGLPCYLPATPAGILEMMRRYEIPTEGKEVVVIGRSNIVGTPISILLSRKAYPGNATVTICHSRTKGLENHLRRADIVVAAIGIPEFVKGGMVKEGVVIIDVGINRVEAPGTEKGYRLCGDVDFESVSPRASLITPVPGGVGQLTVVSLLMNTLKAAKGEIYV